ncbi:acyloxyacyl hydrolase [Ramlibacter montanisoli]|uniref:Lipid A deacylase n=1 Tax=Ramlibacter montanisoli TaxID=2732512 RepID=A0A849KCR6_9BURK|nr:acyloxyacyl hydrolase [Ramlibacter montanisoli]NNU42053.1 acyloxyacyl hydrolase [Ramlibacter montanisoli]
MGLLSIDRILPSGLRPAAAAACFAAALCAGTSAHADEPGLLRRPDAVFVQVGIGEHVKSMTIGAVWDWEWKRSHRAGLLTGYTEISVGQWRVREGGDERYSTQFGITPALRLYPAGVAYGWFVEGGIGANAISPTYRNGSDRFSSVFNFGDHLGVGRRFGTQGQHEIGLRVQHFSNCGLDTPNPGENFVQLRYTQRF